MTVLFCDNSLLRSGLQRTLRGTPFAPAVTASTTHPTLAQDVASESALVVIDASRGTEHVLEVVREVRKQSQKARIVVLGTQFDLDFVRLGHEAGVNGFCVAASTPEVLIKSLELVLLGESVLPFEVLRSFMDAAPQRRQQTLQSTAGEPTLSDLKTHKLSAREAEILSCLREGAPNKIIARKLDITEATIKVHIKSILRKIGVANRTQAAMWATEHLPPREGAGQHL
jgi:two-component system nitrate/nitrite response regulator NarL